VGGYPDGSFQPANSVNRAEAMKMILSAANLSGTAPSSTFSDVPSGAWFAPFVNYAAELEIVNGYPDGTFGPDKLVTRAEIAKMIMNAKAAQ
ncbi:MAG: S-layer homology domain-containing protein, partial [Patescibacteria group bacterium]